MRQISAPIESSCIQVEDGIIGSVAQVHSDRLRICQGFVMKRASIFVSATAALAGVLALCGTAEAAPAPPGSYQQTCQDIYADWNTLSASCRTQFGQWNYTTLANYRACDGDIANQSGRLVCTRDDNDDDDDYQLPRGSYRDTCRNEEADGRTLRAECRDNNGRWRYSELDNYRTCRGDIANANGMLRCRRDDDDDDHDGGYDLPGGSWRYSCRSARIYATVLYAECRDQLGRWRQTSLDLRNCDDDVLNRGGRLVCSTGSGGGFGQITLYKHPNFGGKSRTYTTDVPDLNPYAFGNQASSVVIQGGVWQLCDRPNYRGYCIVVDRTQSNLWVLGFNDRAESIRRVR